MADDSGRSSEQAGSGRLWARLRQLASFRLHETSLRDQIEDAIGDKKEETGPVADPTDDLREDEREMVRNVLHIAERTVGDVAVPRADIIAIAESASFDDLVALFVDAGHSRLPVYRKGLDEIIGMIHVKDVFAILATNAPRPAEIATLIRDPRYVPASMGALDLLEEMRRTRTHLAIVVDEYSGTDGLVTIEDIVEEIVGEIEDEYDEDTPDLLIRLGALDWDADARAPLELVAEKIDPALAKHADEVDTLGGLAFLLAGHVPGVGADLVHDSGWHLHVTDGDDRRVTRLRLTRPDIDAMAAG